MAVGLFSGCAERTTTKSAYQMVMPASAERYELDESQQFMLGERIGSAVLPEYPAAEIHRRLPEQIVCVEIDIGEDGRVFASRPLHDAAGCPAENAQPDPVFYTAAEHAVAQWAFEPARLCTFPPGVPKNDECQGTGVKMENVPIRLAFLFSFTLEHGPRVTGRALEGGK